MFVTFQFPLADARRFVCEYTGRLVAPPWPLADPARHFVRSIGPVRNRRRGFTVDWPGEDMMCDAKGAIKFALHRGAAPIVPARGSYLNPAFRRYYAGGNPRWAGAIARLDMGFSVIKSPTGIYDQSMADEIARYENVALACLTLLVNVPGQTNGARPLVTTGAALARRILNVTTSTRNPPLHVNNWWITPGCPLILIEDLYDSTQSSPLDALNRAWISASRETDPIAAHYFSTVKHRGFTVPVWIVLHDMEADPVALRNLRIHLWRLHNEREVLKSILTLCIEERIKPSESYELRDYLARQSDRLRKRRTEGFAQRDLIDYAYQLDNMVNGSDSTKLKSILEAIGPGLTSSVMPVTQAHRFSEVLYGQLQAPQTLVYLENGNMMVEDNSQRFDKVENVGAIISGNASVSGGNFQGSGTQALPSSVDLDELAKELATLRNELRSRATEMDHDLVVANVATAEKAALDGDRAGVVTALRKAGEWAFGVAVQIGTTVAAAVIKASIGV